MKSSAGFAVAKFLGASVIGITALAASASAQLVVKTVPWQGDPSFSHQVYSGGSIVLQGVAIPQSGCPLTAASWDPGDGTGPIGVSFTNPRTLELTHTYNGLNNQPFIATLTVSDNCGNIVSDQFRVVVLQRTLDVDVNMAIDRGLWNLHNREVLSSVGSVPTGYWTSTSPYGQYIAAATASAVQAFEVHGHRASGNGSEDPYVEDVARGLAHLPTELSAVTLSNQTAGNPDVNGNTIGLQVSSNPIYIGGQVIDALVASETPNATAPTGDATWVLGRTYAAIVQDMIEMYAWGQTESNPWRGGWRYSWNGDADNSACQWMAIGAIAAERSIPFGPHITVPSFVKTENLTYWLTYSQILDNVNPYTGTDGRFGYDSPGYVPWDNGLNTTPSGLVQLVMDNVPSTDARFQRGNGFIARNWIGIVGIPRLYGMFATAKAMRLAVPPVTLLQSGPTSIDWYRNDTTVGDPINGAARTLVNTQQADGSWDEGSPQLVYDDLATAWAEIILSGSVIAPGPVAVCDVEPENTAATFPVTFDGTSSYHPNATLSIVNYEWDFEGDGTFDAVGPVVVHAYPNTGTFNAVLRVTDNSTPSPLQGTSSCVVQITPPPNPPNSDPGGPYDFCGNSTPWILDGTGSSDPDGTVVSYEWDYLQPLNLDFADGSGSMLDVTAYFQTLPPGVYNVALRVTDNAPLQNTDFATVNVRAPGDPACNIGGGPTLDCPPNVIEVWTNGPPTQTDPNHTGFATWTDSCPDAHLSYVDHFQPGLHPGEPETIVTRTWRLVDSCGPNEIECIQTITLLSPSASGGMFLDVRPGVCPNKVKIWHAGNTSFAIAGGQVPAGMIDLSTLRVQRVPNVPSGLQAPTAKLKPTWYGYQDVATPFHGSAGDCNAAGADGTQDVMFEIPNALLRRGLGLTNLPDGTTVQVRVTGKLTDGTTFEARDVLVVSQAHN